MNQPPTTAPLLITDAPMHIGALIYGGAGAGKTAFAGSSQRMRTFYMDVEQGKLTLQRWPAVNRELVHWWPVHTRQDFMNGLNYLSNYRQNYDLAVIDTVTELQRTILRELAQSRKRQAPNQQDWGECLMIMEWLTVWFRSFPMHKVFLAHETDTIDPDTGRTMWRPNFQGAFKVENEKHFDLIGRYTLFDYQEKDPGTGQFTWKTYRFINCQRDAMVHAKDRSNSLMKYEHPDIDTIFAKILTSPNLRAG